jgi:hypothetical protein
MNAQSDRWVVDRRIALPTLIMLVGNLLLGAWLASSAYANLREIDRRVTRLEASDSRQADAFAKIADRLARIEERIISLQRRENNDPNFNRRN